MEKSRERPVVKKISEELRATPRKVLPSVKPVTRVDHHSHEIVHARLANHYNYQSENTFRFSMQADRSMEITRNVDNHNVKKGRPLHERFSSLVASI